MAASNKKPLFIIALLAGAVVAINFTRKAFGGGQLKYRLFGFDFAKKALQIELVNPTNINLNFNALVADVSINGNKIGLVDYRQPTQLTPSDRKIINLPIRLDPVGTLFFTKNLITGGLKKLKNATIAVNGTLQAEGLNIPVNTSIQLNQ